MLILHRFDSKIEILDFYFLGDFDYHRDMYDQLSLKKLLSLSDFFQCLSLTNSFVFTPDFSSFCLNTTFLVLSVTILHLNMLNFFQFSSFFEHEVSVFNIIETNDTIDAFNFFILKFFIKIFVRNAENYSLLSNRQIKLW